MLNILTILKLKEISGIISVFLGLEEEGVESYS